MPKFRTHSRCNFELRLERALLDTQLRVFREGGSLYLKSMTFSCRSATIQTPFCVSQSVQRDFSEPVGIKKLKFGTKEVYMTA